MKVIVIGDSHTAQLHRGVEALKAQGPKAFLGQEWIVRPLGGGHLLPFPFFKVQGEHIVITQPEYRENIHRLPLKTHPDAKWYGVSGALHTARVFRHNDWAHCALPGTDGPGIPVSASLLARLVDDDQRYLKALLTQMQAVGLKPFIIEGPKPFRHHPAVQTVGAAKVLAIDNFFRARMKGWLAQEGIPVAALPADMLGPDGFMHDELRNSPKDPHHGNAEFGRRMILEAVRVVGQAAVRQ